MTISSGRHKTHFGCKIDGRTATASNSQKVLDLALRPRLQAFCSFSLSRRGRQFFSSKAVSRRPLSILIAAALSNYCIGSTPKVMVRFERTPPVQISPGETKETILKFTVTPGLHVQSNPASQPNLIATTLKMESKNGIEFGQPQYPAGKAYRLEGASSDISTYEGSVDIRISLSAKKKISLGKKELGGSLRFQACNEKTCFFPTTLSLKIPIQVR